MRRGFDKSHYCGSLRSMKNILIISTFLISGLVFNSYAQDLPRAEAAKAAPAYQAEAPLPKGWPTPGPYNVVSEKKFPAYRAAFTDGSWQNFAFMRLFKHIQREEIPMTSPVEMEMEVGGEALKMKSMAFMYQNTKVGKTGKNGEKIEVRDVPEMTTLSYTWQGGNSARNRVVAKKALDAELQKRGVKSTEYRILGYNGPGVPGNKKTWEMLIVLP